MDQVSGSVESRSPQNRAVSSEPPSTRPNPFDDTDLTSRKRRRTSKSGSPTLSLQNMSSSTTTDGGNTSAQEEDSSPMRIDTGPTTPQTPEAQISVSSEQTAPPTSSKVTINLRNPALPSTPVSPIAKVNGHPVVDNVGGFVKHSVENGDATATPLNSDSAASPQTLCSGDDSPEIELIPMPNDELLIEDVLILDDKMQLEDPTDSIPFINPNNGETPVDTVMRLGNYISNSAVVEDRVIEDLTDWLHRYSTFVLQAGYPRAFTSYLSHRALWQSVADLIYSPHNRKTPLTKSGLSHQVLASFYTTYARLTAAFVDMDLRTLAEAPGFKENRRGPELISNLYLQAIGVLARREDVRPCNTTYLELEVPWEEHEEGIGLTERLQAFPGGSVASLFRLVHTTVTLIPSHPQLIENLAPSCQIINCMLTDMCRKVPMDENSPSFSVQQKKKLLGEGLALFGMVSDALDTVLEKFMTHLSSDNAVAIVSAMTDIYNIGLHGDDPQAAELVQEYLQRDPELTTKTVHEVIAWRWRFDVFGKMIRTGQMQLRVLAVSNMCQDLVQIWKRFCDTESPTSFGKAYLRYFANYLLETRLVDYILSPTCHPEITGEGGNIVGFLIATKYYRPELTDMLWQTITSSQDPRVSDALMRMMGSITTLYEWEALIYLCEKFQELPVKGFSASIRNFCDSVFKHLFRLGERTSYSLLPYQLCLRLSRESLAYTNEPPTVHISVHKFAISKLDELLKSWQDIDGRRYIIDQCIQDISAKSATTLGSLWCLWHAIGPLPGPDLKVLAEERDLARFLVEELGHAIECGRLAGFPAALDAEINYPRRGFISALLMHEPQTITPNLGLKLWNMLVGPDAASFEDRLAGWHIIDSAAKELGGYFENPFLLTCFSEYLPKLAPEWFCAGTLDFLREAIIPRVNDVNDVALDNDESVAKSGIDQLWRIILLATDQNIASAAIQILVTEIYIESKAILTYPHERARQVHLALVNRCLKQLEGATKRLQSLGSSRLSNGTANGLLQDTESSEEYVKNQERTFIRSLSLLRGFLQTHQSTSHFAAPDLRSFMGQPSAAVEGESAELKYQSFDGDKQTEVKPLNIGKRNTAASLLASLKEATGFDNYRIYYRGHPFTPNEAEICKPLEDLRVHEGLILVRREAGSAVSSPRIKPGSSHLELEILTHFTELWEYLSMEEKFANEIYAFLVKLPAHDYVLERFETPLVSHKEIFIPKQPFKCLYAIYALRQHTESVRRSDELRQVQTPVDGSAGATRLYPEALRRCLSLVVAAISDSEVIDELETMSLKLWLASNITETLVYLLTEIRRHTRPNKVETIEYPSLDRLFAILSIARPVREDTSYRLKRALFDVILLLCFACPGFWGDFQTHSNTPDFIKEFILTEPLPHLRENMTKLFELRVVDAQQVETLEFETDKTTDQKRSVAPVYDFLVFVWSILFDLIPTAVSAPDQSNQFFNISAFVQIRLLEKDVNSLDLLALAKVCAESLLQHTSTEEIGQADPQDAIANGLSRLLECCLVARPSICEHADFPRNLAPELLDKHLLPPRDNLRPQTVRPVIVDSRTRARLQDIILSLTKADDRQFREILLRLDQIVPCYNDPANSTEDLAASTNKFTTNEYWPEEGYQYDLSFNFDRERHVRTSCGYIGLKNLSNTCYLNSLLTQLFMNTGFRQFILNTNAKDEDGTHKLLSRTRELFGYMQESYRRFVDPVALVYSIKTYDDLPIDIHNQMDVDEFYNLLFDRWEAQLRSADKKKTLRSFYGGQLVQQVKSKECEHVSERLEGFQAIQCDIKGKSTLQDSLRAYVEGEVMEGDNKYKCSTCDRHVDAVKRACLKDIPDNLIFHLKRFDFNLRTLQRSKINDHFSFPVRIDMRPYTIDYLDNPEATVGVEDFFELVGVLVHSGTAESGHYYSYVRERPTPGSHDTWIEFNDDSVSPWDPAQMEPATFGGSDRRPPYDNAGTGYDKTFSAYMLFFQRTSSLHAEQERHSATGLRTPLRTQVPSEIMSQVQSENMNLLRRHCLYDDGHISFVMQILQQLPLFNHKDCSKSHKVEDLALNMALSHLDQVVTRCKDIPSLRGYMRLLDLAIDGCARCAVAFYNYFQQFPEGMRMLIQRNPDLTVRQGVGDLFISVLRRIKNAFPSVYAAVELGEDADDEDEVDISYESGRDLSVSKGAICIFDHLWTAFHLNTSVRSWPEVFTVMLRFASLGSLEVALFLAEDYLQKLILMVTADINMDLPNMFVRMLNTLARRMPSRPASFDAVLALMLYLMEHMDTHDRPESIVENPKERLAVNYVNQGSRFPWTEQEIAVLYQDWPSRSTHASAFVEKLIALDQNARATEKILTLLIHAGPRMDQAICNTLRVNISGQINSSVNIQQFLNAAIIYCMESENEDLVQKLVEHIGIQGRFMHSFEGVAFFGFHKTLMELGGSQGFSCPLYELSMRSIPTWAPGLLSYLMPVVRASVEDFLSDVLFQFGPSPNFSEAAGGQERKEMMIAVAKSLAMSILLFLRDRYIQEKQAISKEILASMRAVVSRCNLYFSHSEEAETADHRQFQILVNGVLEPLSRAAVDELEDDGSDWDNSVGSSDQLDELGDISMQAIHDAADMNDVDI